MCSRNSCAPNTGEISTCFIHFPDITLRNSPLFFYKTNRPHHLAAAELRRQGNSLFQQGRTKEALEKYDKAAKMGEFFVVFEGN